ncbi:MAG: DUF1768 domain-containing protein [Clostridia bacterium]|nr:DUF1768 domain-containing protein [Clostridia bacterium]
MTNRIAVMGGSFNPPTVAHLRLMQAGMDAIDACAGIFVPTSHEYVAKKMRKQHCPQDVMNENLRVEMLESFKEQDSRIVVSQVQMLSGGIGFDYDMLCALRQDYPDSELYFIVGSDKLYPLPRWYRVNDLLNQFHILVAKRSADDIEKIKEIKPYLAEHWDAFTVFDAPEEISEISSSLFRERLRAGDGSARELVTPAVWQLIQNAGKEPMNSITNFHEEGYTFLSNFYEAPVTYDGLTYGSAEAAFQAQKCMAKEEKLPFTEARPGKSKGMGRRVKLRPDWEQVKVGLMAEIVRAKFSQNEELKQKLLETGEKRLAEGNTWGDTFWGVDLRSGRGENHLGVILMQVRDELLKNHK